VLKALGLGDDQDVFEMDLLVVGSGRDAFAVRGLRGDK